MEKEVTFKEKESVFSKIRLKNYRLWRDATLEISPSAPLVLIGPNDPLILRGLESFPSPSEALLKRIPDFVRISSFLDEKIGTFAKEYPNP